MLILSRDAGQRVFIRCGQGGPVISVEVVELRGRHVRLGFEAPSDCAIYREEVSEWFEGEE